MTYIEEKHRLPPGTGVKRGNKMFMPTSQHVKLANKTQLLLFMISCALADKHPSHPLHIVHQA